LNIFRRGLVSLYESQNLNSPFANSSLAIGLFEEAGIKETSPLLSIARFFFYAILGFVSEAHIAIGTGEEKAKYDNSWLWP
jgi:hypothetical protein